MGQSRHTLALFLFIVAKQVGQERQQHQHRAKSNGYIQAGRLLNKVGKVAQLGNRKHRGAQHIFIMDKRAVLRCIGVTLGAEADNGRVLLIRYDLHNTVGDNRFLIQHKISGYGCNIFLPAFFIFLQRMPADVDAQYFFFKGKQKFLKAQYVTGKEKYLPAPTSQQDDMKDESTHTWLQLKGRWHEYKEVNDQFNIGFLGEVVLSSKSLLNNYTATVLQAPAFTPTPHSRIVFNEAFRANQYVAAGLSPIIKMGKLLHLRLDLYGFAPLNEIKKETFQSNQSYYGVPYYGKFLRSFEYMGEAAVVLQLPFLSIGIFGNGYSYPSKNFNVGVNIGYLIFNPKMLD